MHGHSARWVQGADDGVPDFAPRWRAERVGDTIIMPTEPAGRRGGQLCVQRTISAQAHRGRRGHTHRPNAVHKGSREGNVRHTGARNNMYVNLSHAWL